MIYEAEDNRTSSRSGKLLSFFVRTKRRIVPKMA
jgi:hypothetical protein